ncbi:hypothetical protein CANDROIZ_180022 [Candidatus Roizmanbacteria bacterium]|nr:hypothetical protein CANDROIZ_180022 [Candidatus Roizmanbacteria bacterium]
MIHNLVELIGCDPFILPFFGQWNILNKKILAMLVAVGIFKADGGLLILIISLGFLPGSK